MMTSDERLTIIDQIVGLFDKVSAMALTTDECIVLILFAALIGGVYVSVRKAYVKKCDSISFIILFATGGIFLALLLWGSLDGPTLSNYDAISIEKAVYIFITGLITSFTVYVFIACAMHLTASVAQACFDVQYVVGVTLTYVISSDNINLEFMIIGGFLIFCGIFFILTSEYFKEHSRSQAIIAENSPLVTAQTPLLPPGGSGNNDSEDNANTTPSTSVASLSKQESKDDHIWYWALLGVSGGILVSSFAVLITLARTGTDAVSNPALILLLFEAGQIIGLPFSLYVFGYLDVLSMKIANIDSVGAVFHNLTEVPLFEAALSFFLGICMAGAYGMYFYGSSGNVPYAIAFLLLASILFFATIASIGFGEYAGIPLYSYTFLFIGIGAIFYILGIFVLVEYSFD